MSPFFGRIALVICATIILSSFVYILNKIHLTKEDWEQDELTQGMWRQHGDYWVWHNYIKRSEDFRGNKSITLTTHGSYLELRFLPTLLERWQGPVSLAIHASGTDFDKTTEALRYLNGCQRQYELMHRFLSIHLVFHSQHLPKNLQRFEVTRDSCANSAPFELPEELTYATKMELNYPINLLRNIARFNAQTYYIMALDLELVPSPNLIKKFLDFIKLNGRKNSFLYSGQPSIYCLATFPHKTHVPLAQSKAELLQLQAKYNIIEPIYNSRKLQQEWLQSKNSKDKISLFKSSSKMNMCVGYVSSNELEPLYDERNDMESIYEQGNNLKAQIL